MLRKRASYRRWSMPQTFLRSKRIATTIRWAFSKTAAPWYKAPHFPKLRDPPRRVSPRAFPKRFMNYVDRSWCGRSGVCKPAASTIIHRTFLVARHKMLFVGDGFDGWTRAINSIPREVTLYQAAIVIMQSRHSSELSYYSRLSTTLTYAHLRKRFHQIRLCTHNQTIFMTQICHIKVKILWHYVSKFLMYIVL